MNGRIMRRGPAQAAACAILLILGCTVILEPIDGRDGGDGAGTQPQTITIRIVNATDNTLDPEIFLSDQPVSADELFTDAHKYTLFGVGRFGLLGGRDADRFEIDCTQARMIGARGKFGGGDDGNDLTNPTSSDRRIVLTQDLSVFCGGRVTFTYSRSADGFTTSFDVSP